MNKSPVFASNANHLSGFNHCLLIEVNDKVKYVMRFPWQGTTLMTGPNNEINMINLAIQIELYKSKINFYLKEGVLLVDYIENQGTLQPNKHNFSSYHALLCNLKKLHKSQVEHMKEFNIITHCKMLLDKIGNKQSPAQIVFDKLFNRLNETCKSIPPKELVICHNNLIRHNIIVGLDNKLHLVDFKLVGSNSFYWDLAMLVISLNLTDHGAAKLLGAYLEKEPNTNELSKLTNYKLVAKMWLVIALAYKKKADDSYSKEMDIQLEQCLNELCSEIFELKFVENATTKRSIINVLYKAFGASIVNAKISHFTPGYSNCIKVKIDFEENSYLLRTVNPLLHAQKENEIIISSMCGKHGVSPSAKYVNFNPHALVVDFLKGAEAVNPMFSWTPKLISKFAIQVHVMHRMQFKHTVLPLKRMTVVDVVEIYLQILAESNVSKSLRSNFHEIRKWLVDIYRLFIVPSEFCIAHNDLHVDNVLVDQSEKVSLIDHEWAGIGIRSMDLGVISDQLIFDYESYNHYIYDRESFIGFLRSYYRRDPTETEVSRIVVADAISTIFNAVWSFCYLQKFGRDLSIIIKPNDADTTKYYKLYRKFYTGEYPLTAINNFILPAFVALNESLLKIRSLHIKKCTATLKNDIVTRERFHFFREYHSAERLMDKYKLVDQSKLPKHVAFIPDDSKSMSRKHGCKISTGYGPEIELMAQHIFKCFELGIHTVTGWMVSNDSIAKKDSKLFFIAFEKILDNYTNNIINSRIKFVHCGSKKDMPHQLVEKIGKLEKDTAKFNRHIFICGINYCERLEIVGAMHRLVVAKTNSLKITTKQLCSVMYTANQPYHEPDLIIRTGANRTSGFMLWNSIYSEWHMVDDTPFPELKKDDIINLLNNYAVAKRDFDRNSKKFTSDQDKIQKNEFLLNQ